MKRNVTVGVLGLVGLALAIVVAVQYREIRSLNRKLDASRLRVEQLRQENQEAGRQLAGLQQAHPAMSDSDKARLEDTISRLKSELDRERLTASTLKARLEKRIADLEAEARRAASPSAPAAQQAAATSWDSTPRSDDRATTSAAADSPMKQMAKMLKNPAMKEMIRSQQKGLVDMTYKSLFDSLDLDDEEKAKLKELLLDRQMIDVELGLQMMDSDLSAEERKETGERIKEAKAESDKALQELLDDKDYEWYKAYEDTKNERMQLNMFNQSLEESLRLTTEQEDALVLAMFDARSEFKSLSDLQNPANVDPSRFTPEMVEALLKDLKAVGEQVALRAVPILNPDQLKQFQSFLDQQRAMQEMGLRMAAQMFGNQNAPAATPAGGTP